MKMVYFATFLIVSNIHLTRDSRRSVLGFFILEASSSAPADAAVTLNSSSIGIGMEESRNEEEVEVVVKGTVA